MPLSIIILLIVLIAIAVRKLFRFHIPIWIIMGIGAIAVLVTGQITPAHAIKAINPDVMLYLFGVFVVAAGLEISDYLERMTDRLFNRSRVGYHALFIIIFVLGLSSALLMNDTIAIVGTPIVLQLCRSHKSLQKPLLLALAFAITIGSVTSPIGNPQNLLIAIKSQMSTPFLSFFGVLFIPTLINLIIAYGFIYFIFRKHLSATITKATPVQTLDPRLSTLAKVSVCILLLLIIIRIILSIAHASFTINFSLIAIIAALPILIFSSKRWKVLKYIDWGTLVFFIALFILMQSVWDSGFFQTIIQHSHVVATNIPTIMLISTVLSQFISNVPLVALYLPLLTHAASNLPQYLALAAGSTIAGNLFIFGAASNIIIIQNAEKRGAKGFGFLAFAKVGIPLTIINLCVYWLFLALIFAH